MLGKYFGQKYYLQKSCITAIFHSIIGLWISDWCLFSCRLTWPSKHYTKNICNRARRVSCEKQKWWWSSIILASSNWLVYVWGRRSCWWVHKSYFRNRENGPNTFCLLKKWWSWKQDFIVSFSWMFSSIDADVHLKRYLTTDGQKMQKVQ